jgi:hypothetical protein
MEKIRFYRMKLPGTCIFAISNNLCQSIYLCLRGYSKQDSIVGTIWLKEYIKGGNLKCRLIKQFSEFILRPRTST